MPQTSAVLQVFTRLYNTSVSKSSPVISLLKQGRTDDAISAFQNKPDRYGASALIANYTKQPQINIEKIFAVYRDLCTHIKPDLFVFNAIVVACRKSGKAAEALPLWQDMQRYKIGLNDDVSFGSWASVAFESNSLYLAKELLAKWKKNEYIFETPVGKAMKLIATFTRHSDVLSVLEMYRLFSKLETPTLSLIGAVLNACNTAKSTTGLFLWQDMKKYKIIPDLTCIGMFASACKLAKDAATALEILDQMKQGGILQQIPLECQLLTVLLQACQSHKPLDIKAIMALINARKIDLDVELLALLFTICADHSAFLIGEQLYDRIVKAGVKPDVILQNSLIYFFGKCGEFAKACAIFTDVTKQCMLQKELPNVDTYTAMIAAYAYSGLATEAIQLFNQMILCGVQPNHITFIALLNACSHIYSVDLARYYFDLMVTQYHIERTNSHYNCMVDVLSRAGKLEEAEELINQMHQPDVITWITLLSGCLWKSDVPRGVRAASNATALDPKNAAVYVLLSNLFASVGNWDKVAEIRNQMKQLGIKKIPGTSTIEVIENGEPVVHAFTVEDKSHPATKAIYNELHQLDKEIRNLGYVPQTLVVLHDVDELEKERMLCYHSERLAIVYGLLKTLPGTPLRVNKNLRTCKDCHDATRYIAKARNRTILLSDASRYHFFKPDGTCSCNGKP